MGILDVLSEPSISVFDIYDMLSAVCAIILWMAIFVVFVEGPIHEFQYPRKSDFCMNYEWKCYGHEFWTPFAPSTKIGTHENKAIQSKQNTNFGIIFYSDDITIIISLPLLWKPKLFYSEIMKIMLAS